MEKFKRKLALLSVFIMLVSYHMFKPKYPGHFELLENEEAFAKCDCGYVYIGDKEYLKTISGENCILVEDARKGEDPDMKIYASCNIRSSKDRDDIIRVLQKYEELHPSDWERTTEAMRLEWLMHNFSYFFDYETHRTEDVDLDNNEEELYNDKLLQKLFRVN